MKCPVCPASTLVLTDRSGVEIDYCPTCRGVWLDRGELDKIIERVGTLADPSDTDRRPPRQTATAPLPPPTSRRRNEHDDHDRDDDDDDRLRNHGTDRRKKRKSLLGELFDF